MQTKLLAALLTVTSIPALAARAQDCEPPAIVFNAKAENIFSPEQEMHLGDAMFERLQRDYRVIDDAEVNAYLQKIGDRLSRHLPDTGIRFKFAVTDMPEANAYAMAGGRIFVTRKLISFVRSEDELAGVIGHEIGHAVVRHHTIDLSRYFRQLLNVASVGDRQDVFNKYNQFIETWRTKRVTFSNNHEDNQQIEADRIGLFAVYAAGYDPNGYTDFWKRFTDAKKTNFFTELFGTKRLADKRLKELLAAMKSIPPACLEARAPGSNDEFEKWRRHVINFSGLGAKESLNGLIERRRLVPLRSDIEHLRFSPNGRYIIAQDSSTVTVLRREPLSVLFRFEIDDALPATFTSDSKTVVVYNRNLRVQKWDIEQQSLVSTNEIAVPGGFWQTKGSPDGNIIASYKYNGDLVLYDIATNTEIYKEKKFYLPTRLEVFLWQLTRNILDVNEYPAVNMEFSPDGRYFIAGRKFSVGYVADRQETIAVDLHTGKTVPIGDNIKKVLVSSFSFLSPDKVIGRFGDDIHKSGIFAFPSGDRIEQFELGGLSFLPAESGTYVTVRPVSGAAVAIYDLKAKKYILANKKSALDVFDKVLVSERRNGEIAVYALGTNELLAAISLPASPFGSLRTSALSGDGKWLAVSDRSRGAVWNLKTGERVLHIRSFRGSYFANDGKVYADFPKMGDIDRTVAVMDPGTGAVKPGGNIDSKDNVRQHGPYLLVRRPLKERADRKEKPENERIYSEEEPDRIVRPNETAMGMLDALTGKTLWTREFPDETPAYSIDPVQDTMTFSWSMRSKAAKDIIKSNPALGEKAAAMQEKAGDVLIQIIEPKTGAVKGHFLLETGQGSFSVERIRVAGDFLSISDDENRNLVYSISTGRLVQRFFGSFSAISPQNGSIAIENQPGRVTVYDIISGRERERLSFTKPVAMLQFLDGGKRLFVLTAEQTSFMFDTAKFGSAAAEQVAGN